MIVAAPENLNRERNAHLESGHMLRMNLKRAPGVRNMRSMKSEP